MMCVGVVSGVNWIRLNDDPSTCAIARASSVLALPGGPSTSTCPCASAATRKSSTAMILADDDLAHLRLRGLAKVAHAVEARLVRACPQDAQIVVSGAHIPSSRPGLPPHRTIQSRPGGDTPQRFRALQRAKQTSCAALGDRRVREEPAALVEHGERPALERRREDAPRAVRDVVRAWRDGHLREAAARRRTSWTRKRRRSSRRRRRQRT